MDKTLMLNQIMEHLKFTKKSDFARFLGVKPNTLSNWFKRNTFDEDIISQKCEFLDPIWIKTGMGEMLKVDNTLIVQENAEKYHVGNTTISTFSNQIPITDINVAAGDGYINHVYTDQEDVLVLPENMMGAGKHLCVRVKGNSMAPTIQDSGYVVISLVEKPDWQNLRNEHVYVVSDMEGKAYLKRIKNRFKKGFITLMSDNPDRATYPNFNLQAEEINTIWHAEWYLSAKMPNVHDQYYSRLQRVENKLEDLENKFKKYI